MFITPVMLHYVICKQVLYKSDLYIIVNKCFLMICHNRSASFYRKSNQANDQQYDNSHPSYQMTMTPQVSGMSLKVYININQYDITSTAAQPSTACS